MDETIKDESEESSIKMKLVHMYKKRVDQVNIERYRTIQRLGQYLTYVLHFYYCRLMMSM